MFPGQNEFLFLLLCAAYAIVGIGGILSVMWILGGLLSRFGRKF